MPTDDQTIADALGQPSFIGFEYQILVTAWLALEFIVVKGASEILVEPPSKEDVEAELKGEKSVTNVTAKSFLIQIKLLSNALWTANAFKKLIGKKVKKGNSGPEPRIRALELLEADERKHYILITTADVEPKLRGFSIKEIEETPKSGDLNALATPPSVTRRIGILASETEHSVRNRISLLLQKYCCVPGEEIDGCISNLQAAIRERMAGRKPIIFPREELECLLSIHRGSFALREKFTHPDNLDEIRNRLIKDNVVLLIGPPGTGKSTLARMLVDEYRMANPPVRCRVVREREDLNFVHATINATHSHVYFVEDPWGQGKPDDKARFFTTELAPLLNQARAGKTFIVTSRLAPYREAIEDRPDYRKWEVVLDAKCYSPNAYREIYEKQLEDWQESARTKAMGVIDAALRYLETPYAVAFFCGELKKDAHEGWVNERKAIQLAKQSNIHVFGRRLKERIIDVGRSEIIPALAIWAQLTAKGDCITLQEARELRRHLKDSNLSDVSDVESFFSFLTTSRWLQKRECGFVATPSVKEALQSVSSNRGDFEDTMGILFQKWIAHNQFHSVLLCLREAKWDDHLVPLSVAIHFDSYLVTLATNADARNFIYSFRELAEYSTTNAPATAFARALCISRKEYNGRASTNRLHPVPPQWTRPSLSVETVSQIAGDSSSMICARKFVVDHLTDPICHNFFGNTYPRKDLLVFLLQFEWPLFEWFTAALADILKNPSESTAYMVECVLDLMPSNLDALIVEVATVSRGFQLGLDLSRKEGWRRYIEGETHEWQDPADMEDDTLYHVNKALAAGIARKIKEQGHSWILGHPYELELFDAWSDLICKDKNLVARQTFVVLCEKYGRTEAAAKIILETPDSSFHGWAVRTLLSADFRSDTTAKWVLLTFAKSCEFLEHLKLESASRFESAKSLLTFLVLKQNGDSNEDAARPEKGEDPFFGYETLAPLLKDAQKRTLITCCKQTPPPSAIIAGEVEMEFLALLAKEWPETPAIDALEIIVENRGSPDQLIERFLDSDDSKVRVRAWALCKSRSRHLQEALRDPHYGCRNAALNRLSDNSTPEELTTLLSRAGDPSAYVREHLAELIGAKGLREGIPALITLLSDKRDYGDRSQYDEGPKFDVARSACDSLELLSPLEEKSISLLRSFLEACESSSVDPVVHEKLFRILERYPSSENTVFCSRYINAIWLGSKWNTLGGTGIVQCCLRTICAYFCHDPFLARVFDFSMLIKIAEWKKDESGILAYSLAALALGYDADTAELSLVLEMDSFSAQKGRLVATFSRRVRNQTLSVLKKHVPDEYSFLPFLQWADNSNGTTFAEFSAGHSDFLPWLASLKIGNDFEMLLHEAANRLVSAADPSASLATLPLTC